MGTIEYIKLRKSNMALTKQYIPPKKLLLLLEVTITSTPYSKNH